MREKHVDDRTGAPRMSGRGAWRVWGLLAAWLFAWAAGGARAAEFAPVLPVTLVPTDAPVEVDTRRAWRHAPAALGVVEVASGQLPRAHSADEGSAAWLALSLRREPSSPALWRVELPSPTLDRVSFHWKDEQGRWRTASAGDRVPRSAWPQAGRHPGMTLSLPADGPSLLWLRVEHGMRLAAPVRLLPADTHERRSRLAYLLLGLGFGALGLVVAAAVWQACVLRDRSHAQFAAYGSACLLAAASITGLAGDLLWGEWTPWADLAPGCLALLAGALGLVVMRQLTRATARGRTLSAMLRALAWAGVAAACTFAFLVERRHGVLLLGVYLFAATAAAMVAALLSWRRGDPVGRWMALAVLPLLLVVPLELASLLGLVHWPWASEAAVLGAVAWSLPVLRIALRIRLRERRSTQLRQQALASHDALTGLPKLNPFRVRLRRVLARHAQRGDAAALMVVSVANHAAVESARGAEAAEEGLLRAVIKIQALVQDVDALARVGDGSFAVLLEGVEARGPVSEFASRLIASGLMQDPEHPDDPLLQFHVAAVLLHEHPAPGVMLVEELQQLLGTMSPRTRRPVRYLNAQVGGDSSLMGDIARTPGAHQLDRIPEVI
ncbi:7TM diverse intracellular signaling domain-containing protein [Ramlibacter rhizophilus]|uniref:Diguanylate cyclase n=1 Tax=Ramlibacter rhizophilus TaxID=1781167 RepID=A0A4Z0BQR8_9BURK|nr:7TM diverse intracellular signaling domain-containing protein [Ramlibacter rhizophilus]TFZ01181.1 diguanylate cyclase [Ramlibacter rhizophilus]